MKNNSNIFSSAIVFILFTVLATISYAQTEGFNVKTPIEKIADSATKFLNQIVSDSKKHPTTSIPMDTLCSSKCFLVIPEIEMIESRGDFAGTGLMSCQTPNRDSFSEPLYYSVTNLKSFKESGGGIVILATSTDAMNTLLGDNVHLTSEISGTGIVGKTSEGESKPFVGYAKPKNEALVGYDLSGALVNYSSKDTFDAYQGTVVPIEIFISPQDVPPMLRDFGSSLKEWTKSCK